MNVFDLSAKITMDINGYLKGMDTAKGIALSTMSVIGGAVSEFMDQSIDVGKKFDSSMSQVGATMGKTAADMGKDVGSVNTAFGKFEGNLRDFAQFMGRNTAFTASQAADALNYMALAGYNTQQSMEMLPNVLNLAAAGNMDLARASDMVTDTQTAFGITFPRTSRMVDEMAKAASTGNTSVEQLGDAFLVVGGLAKELNGGMVTLSDGTQKETDGIQELEIALTAMANAGVKGSEAGTHMRNMLMKLSSPTADGTKRLEELGVKVFDAEGNMRSLKDIMGDLNTSLGTLTQEEKIQAISDLFNARDLSSAQALLGAVSQDWDRIGESILNAEVNGKGYAQVMAEIQQDNLAGDTKKFESALEGLQLALSDAVTPAMRAFKQEGTQAILDITNVFKDLPPEMQTVIGLFGDLGGKVLSIAPQIMGLAGNFAQLKTASILAGNSTGSFVTSLGKVGPALGFVGGAITVGTLLWGHYKDKVNEATTEQQGFATEIEGQSMAYDATHEMVQTLINDSSEYSDISSRITQLEAARAQVVSENADAQASLKDAQDQLADTTEELNKKSSEYEETLLRTGEVVGMNYEDMGILSEQQKILQGTVETANETYEQSTKDLEAIDAELASLYEQQKLQAEAVENTTEKYAEMSQSISQDVMDSAEQIINSVHDMEEALTGSVKSVGNWFEKVEQQEAKSAETMKQNLRAQIQHVTDWERDLNFLADKGINKEFLTYLANMGPQASNYVLAMKEDVLAGGKDTVDEWNALYKEKLDLETGVNDEAQNIYSAIGKMAAGGDAAFETVIKRFGAKSKEAGKGMTSGLIQSLESEVGKVKSAGEDVGEAGVEGVDTGAGTHSPSWKTKLTGSYMGIGLVQGINSQAGQASAAGANIGWAAVNGANSVNLYGQGYSIGHYFVAGISYGIGSSSYMAMNTAMNMAYNIVSATKNILKMRSPSKVGEEIGQFWDEGIAGGVVKNANYVIDASVDMADKMIEETNKHMVMPNADFSNALTPYEPQEQTGSNYTDEEQQRPMNVTMNIYGAQGQDVRELAEIVSRELAVMFKQQQAVWA